MLFLIHRPTHLQVCQHERLVLVTSQQIIFTSIHFLEEFLSHRIPSSSPHLLAYSEETFEAAIASQDSIQVYWTDWQSKTELRYFIALFHEPVYSLSWNYSWTAFGDFRQYGIKKIRLKRTQSYDQEFSSCFAGNYQFILTNKRLVRYDHSCKKLQGIDWGDCQNKLDALVGDNIQIKAILLKDGRVAIALSNIFLLLKDIRVAQAIQNEGKLYISKNSALWIEQGKTMIVYQILPQSIIKLGDIEAFEGHYLGSSFTQQKAAFIFYDFKQIRVNYIDMVDEQQNIQFATQRLEKKKYQQQILQSTVTQRNNFQQKHTIPPIQSVEQIQLQTISPNQQLALKASIQKFQEQLQKSFDSPMKTNIIYGQQKQEIIDQIVASPVYHPSNEGNTSAIDIDSLGIMASQINGEGLVEHGQEGFEWQKMQPNEEQNQASNRVDKLEIFENQLQHIDFAMTPAFNDLNNHWGDHQEWNFLEEAPKEQPIYQESSSRSLSIQKKSSLERQQIQRRVTQILGEIFRKDPEKFDETLENRMSEVIQEKQARIFFADHIRIHNPDLTRDRLLRLYRHVEDTQANKRLMGAALSDFRLEEVPLICLPLRKQLLSVFQRIYPAVYIEDLLSPTMSLYQELIQSYFSRKFTQQALIIEDEKIQLAHPRNLLNIILYLNDQFQLPLEGVFEVYIKKTLRHDQVPTIRRILDSNVCQICGINKEIIEKTAENTLRQLLEQGKKGQLIEEVMLLLPIRIRKVFIEIASLIGYFRELDIAYQVGVLLNLPNSKNGEAVLSQLLNKNSASNIAKLSFPFLFKAIGRIQEDKSITYYQKWHFNITKQAAEILCANAFLQDGISTLFPIAPILKRHFVCRILFKYFGGKFANRLAAPRQNITDIFKEIFTELLNSGSRDDIINNNDPQWINFMKICKQKLKLKYWELAYILYHDRQLGKELIGEKILTEEEFQSIPIVKKGKHLRFMELDVQQPRIPLFFDADSHKSNQSVDLNQSYSPKNEAKQILQHSFRGFDAIREVDPELCRSVRRRKLSDVDPALILLKIEVQRDSILAMLREIYDQQPRDKFLAALNVVDRERVQLHHIDLYKSLVQTSLSLPLERYIPFEYFIGEEQVAWKIVQSRVKCELDVDNFWGICLLIRLLYGKQQLIMKSFLEKIVFYEIDDKWSEPIQIMLKVIKVDKDWLSNLKEQAAQRGLDKIAEQIDRYISNK